MMTTVHVSLDVREKTFSAVIGLCFPVDRVVHDDGHADFDGRNCATSWAHGEGQDVEKAVRSQWNGAFRC